MKIFVLFNTVNACSTLTFIPAIIRDGFGVCFVVPNVLHFGDTVAVLLLVKYVLLLVVGKIHEVIPTRFFDITAFFISYLLKGWIDLLIIYSTQSRHTVNVCPS